MPGPFYFAWTGGTIQPPTTLVTNGDTHGALFQTVSIVGDITAGGRQIQNIASVSDLEIGKLYFITGPGIPSGTFFIYDTGPGNDPEGSVNLSGAATATLASATFTVTKPTIVGEVPSSITSGSDLISFIDANFPAGIYGVQGTGIGQTNAPVPVTTGSSTIITGGESPIMLVPAAWIAYDGSSGGATMATYISTAHNHTSWDSTFGPTTSTTWVVSEQQVLATTSGVFPLVISGAPDGNWWTIDNIPSDAIASLQAGLRYDISGPGIQNGTTFIAPAPGATSITLDLPASAAQINAVLTITGPRVPNAAFDATVDARFDEQVIGFEIGQEEGGFPTLSIDLLNPQIGLLALGRNLWCWLSYDQNWSTGGSPDIIPLFNGRLVGIPKLQAGEIVQLQFLARPDDFTAQKDAVIADLAVLPYYDPVWLAANLTPDTVLETYSALWHIDRTTLVVSASDVLEGEDGTITIGEDVAFYDDFSLSYGQPPLYQVTVTGTVSWNQQGDGFVDVTDRIVSAFNHAGSPWGATYPVGGGLISCLCGDGLYQDWPKPGINVGGGWSLTTLNDGSGLPLCYIQNALYGQGGWIRPQWYNVTMGGMTPAAVSGTDTADTSNVGLYFTPIATLNISFPINIYKIRMTLRYEANRKRTETVTMVLAGDVQKVLSDTSDADRDTLDFTSEYVSQGVDPDGEVPIGDLRRASYFQTDRGTASLEYLLLAARAKIRFRARAVDVTFGTDFATALGITLRNSVAYFDRRIPGGSATGKVKSYRIMAGEDGMKGEFTIGCAIGNGIANVPPVGINSYVVDGYVDQPYQVIAGAQTSLVDEELSYQPLDEFAIDDDGVDLTSVTSRNAVNECVVSNGLLEQLNAMATFQGQIMPTFGDPITTMQMTLKTTVTLDMRPLAGGEFHTAFFPAVSMLALPKAIDLSVATGLAESMWDAHAPTSIWDSGSSTWDHA